MPNETPKKRPSGTTDIFKDIQDVKAVVELMRGLGVTEFKVGSLEVTFGGGTPIPVEVEDDPEKAKQKELDDIKLRLQQMNDAAVEEEMWSV